jgi:YcxB-like protein
LDQLEYDIRPEDNVAFGVYFNMNSEQGKLQRRYGSVFTTLLGSTLGFAVVELILNDVRTALIAGLAGGLASLAMWPWMWRRQLNRTLLRTASSGGLGSIGPHRLFVDGEGLHEETTGTKLTTAFPSIRRIEQTNDHVFVFVGEARAVIIPKRVGSSEVAAFLGEVERHRTAPA